MSTVPVARNDALRACWHPAAYSADVVHPGLLGDPSRPIVAPHAVQTDGHVLRYAYGRPDAANTEAFPVFAAEERKDDTRRTRYALHLPYTIVEHIDWGAADGLVYLTFDAVAVAYRRAMRAHGLS